MSTAWDRPVGVRAHLKGSWESVTIVVVGLATAAASFGLSCVHHGDCSVRHTCVDAAPGQFAASRCSFSTSVSFETDLAYSDARTGTSTSLSKRTRGACAVGDRDVVGQLSDAHTCLPLHPFPNAINTEVQDLSVTGPMHERACGRWLRVGKGSSTWTVASRAPVYFSFRGEAERFAAVRRVEAALHNTQRVASTSVSKLRAACQRTVAAGGSAVRLSAREAYLYLRRAAGVGSVSDDVSVAHAVGVLSGHYCDAPLVFEMRDTGSVEPELRVRVHAGVSVEDRAMGEALFVLGAPRETQFGAERANRVVGAAAVRLAVERRSHSDAHMQRVALEAAVDVGAADAAQYTDRADVFEALIATARRRPHEAGAYLDGVSALCALASQRLLLGNSGVVDTTGAVARNWVSEAYARRPRALALGELHAPTGEPLEGVGASVLQNDIATAASARLTQLVAHSHAEADAACLAFTRAMFPAEVARMHHDIVVPERMYARLEALVADMRAAMFRVVERVDLVRRALPDPQGFLHLVNRTRVRIVGAPPATWASGRRAAAVTPRLESDDGVLVMAAKQARSHFQDRFAVTNGLGDVCDAYFVYSPLTTQATKVVHRACVHLYLGTLMAPWYAHPTHPAQVPLFQNCPLLTTRAFCVALGPTSCTTTSLCTHESGTLSVTSSRTPTSTHGSTAGRMGTCPSSTSCCAIIQREALRVTRPLRTSWAHWPFWRRDAWMRQNCVCTSANCGALARAPRTTHTVCTHERCAFPRFDTSTARSFHKKRPRHTLFPCVRAECAWRLPLPHVAIIRSTFKRRSSRRNAAQASSSDTSNRHQQWRAHFGNGVCRERKSVATWLGSRRGRLLHMPDLQFSWITNSGKTLRENYPGGSSP